MADISKIKLPNNTTYDINATTVNGHTVDKNVPSNAVFTDTNTHRPIQVNGTQVLGNNTTALNLIAGDNVYIANAGGSVSINADQIDDSYTYDQYQDLPSTTKMQDKIFMVKDAPNPPAIPVVDEYAREQIEDVKSNLTDLQSNLITTQTYNRSAEFSLSAGQSSYVTWDVTKQGYTPLGIISISGSGTSTLAFEDWYLDGNTAYFYFRNVSSSRGTYSNLKVKILYFKNFS